MIFDTDVFIWIQRGSERAAEILERHSDRFIAVQTYMELMQGAQNIAQQTAAGRQELYLNGGKLSCMNLVHTGTAGSTGARRQTLPHECQRCAAGAGAADHAFGRCASEPPPHMGTLCGWRQGRRSCPEREKRQACRERFSRHPRHDPLMCYNAHP